MPRRTAWRRDWAWDCSQDTWPVEAAIMEEAIMEARAKAISKDRKQISVDSTEAVAMRISEDLMINDRVYSQTKKGNDSIDD